MRVVVNRLVALRQKTGVGHYTDQLLGALANQAGDDAIDDFPQGWLRRTLQAGVRTRPYLERRASQPSPGIVQRSLARIRQQGMRWLREGSLSLAARRFRRVCARQNYDLYHEPNYIPLPSDCPTVVSVHDLSVVLHPEWHPADRVAHFERHFQRGLERSVHVLTGSEFTRQELITVLRLPARQVTRTYYGVRPGLRALPPTEVRQTLEHLGLPARYLLHVGTIEPRKNILLLLKAYGALPERLRAQWPLLLVGGWGWNTAAVADYFHREARHRGVIQLGYVAEEHLAALYNGAHALVCPSWYEGFGLPPLEMLACGGAVLASTAGALVEIVGRQAQLIPPDDLEGWRDAMARVLTDNDWWQHLRHGATDAARPFTWEQCAAETLHVYRTLCGAHAEPRPATPAALHERRRAG